MTAPTGDLTRHGPGARLPGVRAHANDRRLCLWQLGRSPMQQVTSLRLHRAADLLASTRMKVEEVSQTVGYENAFAFSTAFKKWVGWSPSDYRTRGVAPPRR